MLRKPTTIVAAYSDLHTNSRVGLLPPEFVNDDGAGEPLSKAQRWLWARWLEYWDWIAELKKEHRAHVVGLGLGDLLDKNRKGLYQLVSQDEDEIIAMALAALKPAQAVTDQDIIVRGTPTHTGDVAHLEKTLAREAGATLDEDGRAAWWAVYNYFEDVLIYAVHRPETAGWLVHTAGPGVARNKEYLRLACLDDGLKVPDVALFGHTHRPGDTGDLFTKPRVVNLPPWKLTDAYVQSRGKGHRIVPVGGVAVVCRGDGYEVMARIFRAPRRQPCQITTNGLQRTT